MDWTTISSLGSATAAVIVVVLFLKHLRDDRSSRDRLEEARLKNLENVGQLCHEHTTGLVDSLNTVLRDNSEVIKENTKVLGECLGALKLMNGRAK